MPRPRKVIRPAHMHLKLPEDLVARLELELYSETEGRVPQGAKQDFFVGLMRKHFRELDEGRAAKQQQATATAATS